eukprot:TRINITY_DN4287_c0_g1_i1.p2 TRINITY_DN4287_c0_g1~~TRINITY_DN4287_c0_g1_i1.p2  ORF type:complete len:300 (+),score=105.24 TRINITY_DN4287_c0_g1_i1:1592-2491(+)
MRPRAKFSAVPKQPMCRERPQVIINTNVNFANLGINYVGLNNPPEEEYVEQAYAVIRIKRPSLIASPFYGTPALLGPKLNITGIEGELAIAQPLFACSPIENDVRGKIVLVQRGECMFLDKILNVQNAGGVAVVVFNDREGPLFTIAKDPERPELCNAVALPSMLISLEEGDLIRAHLVDALPIRVEMFSGEDYSDVDLAAQSQAPGVQNAHAPDIAQNAIILELPPNSAFTQEELMEIIVREVSKYGLISEQELRKQMAPEIAHVIPESNTKENLPTTLSELGKWAEQQDKTTESQNP